jgi:hypothetical protein
MRQPLQLDDQTIYAESSGPQMAAAAAHRSGGVVTQIVPMPGSPSEEPFFTA